MFAAGRWQGYVLDPDTTHIVDYKLLKCLRLTNTPSEAGGTEGGLSGRREDQWAVSTLPLQEFIAEGLACGLNSLLLVRFARGL